MASARVVQLSDTHIGVSEGRPRLWDALAAWLAAEPPDLLVHTGDVVLLDPDDVADRRLARHLVGELADAAAAPLVVIPGNHDVGFFDEGDQLPRRLDAFRATWGPDTFRTDLAGWRLVGADTYRLGQSDHDEWLADAVCGELPVAMFVHQPLRGDPSDGWEQPATSTAAFEAAVAGADVRVVASGHRHCAAVDLDGGRTSVWAPSTRFVGDPGDAPYGAHHVDARLGVLEHRLHDDGRHEARVVRPWGAEAAR